MKKVYYKHSFLVKIQLLDCTDTPVGIPECDWSARIYTPGSRNVLIIAQVGGEALGWAPTEAGEIKVAVDNHGLRPGILKAEFLFRLDDNDMPDGIREILTEYDLLELSADPCCCYPSATDVKVLLPVIKGEPGDPPRPVAPIRIITDTAEYTVPVYEPGVSRTPILRESGYYGYYGDEPFTIGSWDI